MSSELSPQNERFIQQAVASGYFPNRGQALDQAVDLLKRRVALLAHVEAGTRELEAGAGIALADDDELRAFFAAIKSEGLQQYRSRQ
jgi:Arc/MetJ-type ribon-helix-helix transcriptional regulator